MAYKNRRPLLEDHYYRFPQITVQLNMQVPFYLSLVQKGKQNDKSHLSIRISSIRLQNVFQLYSGSGIHTFKRIQFCWFSLNQPNAILLSKQLISEYQFSQNTYCKVPIILLYKIQTCLKQVYFFETVLLWTVISPPTRDFYLKQLNIHANHREHTQNYV